MGRIGPMEILIVLAVLAIVLLVVFGTIASWIGRITRRGADRAARERADAEARAAAARRPPAASVVERERVVERQVLVTRCKFCKKLTPVDLTACAECGATQ